MNFVARVKVRLRDHDLFGRVNNAAYATCCEQAYVYFFEGALDTPLSNPYTIVMHLELDCCVSIEGVDAVGAEVEADEPDGKSFPICYTLSYEGEVVATGETVQVTIDGEGCPTRVPDQWRGAIADQSQRPAVVHTALSLRATQSDIGYSTDGIEIGESDILVIVLGYASRSTRTCTVDGR